MREQVTVGTLRGEWHHTTSRSRLIIICHGYKGSSKDPTIVAISDGLNKKGHDTFTFNFSKNAGGFDIEHQVHDINQIVDYFNQYKQIVLLAGSFAALPAAISTSKSHAISRLITLNGFFGTGALGKNHRKTYIKFRIAALIIPKYRNILKYFKRELLPGAIRVPVLVIHSKVDPYVYSRQSRIFYKQLVAHKRFVELQHANHGVTAPEDRQIVISEIDAWLNTLR